MAPHTMLIRRVIEKVSGYCRSLLSPTREASGLTAVPSTAEHYAVSRGDYAQVGTQTINLTEREVYCLWLEGLGDDWRIIMLLLLWLLLLLLLLLSYVCYS